jgi:hypothetical protein
MKWHREKPGDRACNLSCHMTAAKCRLYRLSGNGTCQTCKKPHHRVKNFLPATGWVPSSHREQAIAKGEKLLRRALRKPKERSNKPLGEDVAIQPKRVVKRKRKR